MSAEVLLDTNVLIYAYDQAAGEKGRLAQEILDWWITRKKAAISTQVLSEFILAAQSSITPALTPSELHSSVDRLARSLPVLPITSFVVREAVRGMKEHQLSYWDAQIWATARLNQIPVIFTDEFPGQTYLEGVRYINPFDL